MDHIVPRNQCGSDDLSNLQALCFRCNAGKRDAGCQGKRAHRLPRRAGQLRPPRSGLCVLRAGGQRSGADGERAGAVHRRCLSRERGTQPGDPAAPWGRRAGAAPAGMERRGGAAQCPGRVDQRLECGAELRCSGWADGVSCALASDSQTRGGLRGAAGWGAGGDHGKKAY